jgi:hypothetical protein
MKGETSPSEEAYSAPKTQDSLTRRQRDAFRLRLALRSLGCTDYGRICLTALGSVFLVAFLSFPFFFAPGWANGWTGGLTIHQVWSTWWTLTLLVMLLSFGVSVGSLVSLICCLFPRGRRRAGIVFGCWLVIWAILSLGASLWAWPRIYADIQKELSNG